jgi:hypothetical protein
VRGTRRSRSVRPRRSASGSRSGAGARAWSRTRRSPGDVLVRPYPSHRPSMIELASHNGGDHAQRHPGSPHRRLAPRQAAARLPAPRRAGGVVEQVVGAGRARCGPTCLVVAGDVFDVAVPASRRCGCGRARSSGSSRRDPGARHPRQPRPGRAARHLTGSRRARASTSGRPGRRRHAARRRAPWRSTDSPSRGPRACARPSASAATRARRRRRRRPALPRRPRPRPPPRGAPRPGARWPSRTLRRGRRRRGRGRGRDRRRRHRRGPADVFDGFAYVALGHLHGRRSLAGGACATPAASTPPRSPRPATPRASRSSRSTATRLQVEEHPLRPPRRRARARGPSFDEVLAGARRERRGARGLRPRARHRRRADRGGAAARLRAHYPRSLLEQASPPAARPRPAAAAATHTLDPREVTLAFLRERTGQDPSDLQLEVLDAALAVRADEEEA